MRLRDKLSIPTNLKLKIGLLLFASCYLLMLILTILFLQTDDPDSLPGDIKLLKNAMIQGIVCAYALMLIIYISGKKGLEEAGFYIRKPNISIPFSLSVYLSFIPIYILFCFLNEKLFDATNQKLVKEMVDNPAMLESIPVILCSSIFIPFTEEVLFRGVLQSGLKQYLRPLPAIIISAAVFALAHERTAWLPIFSLGLLLGYLKESTESLYSSMLIHAIHNSLMMFYIFSSL